MSSVLSRWWRLVGFASVPGSPQEARAFVQRRIALYLGFVCVLWTIAFISGLILDLLSGFGGPLGGEDRWLHGGTCVALGAAWLLVRRRPLGDFALNVVDAGATKLQVMVLCVLLLLSVDALEFRPDLSLLLGMNSVLITRATLVPGSSTRALSLGAGASAMFLVTSYYVFRNHHVPGYPGIAVFYVAWDGVWCVMTIVSTTFVAYVTYALRRKVQESIELGQYVLEKLIGEGGMGTVYLARHALLRRPTAIKLLPPERAGEESIARFEREVRMTSQLTHPNTVAIYDYGHTPEGVFYYAMEYLEGVDLETLVVRDGAQPPGRVRHILSQIAEALREAHHAGLIHRDIKPANIMLCERGLVRDFVKVVDFGLVREIESPEAVAHTDVNVIMGTPLYMSPEQILNPSGIDARSDLYALGAVGYFLLAGTPVFEGKSVVQVCAHHLHSPVPPIEDRSGRTVPAKLEAVIRRCLEKDPKDRPQDAAELLDELARCDDVPVWSARDANSWWEEHAEAVKKKRAASQKPTAVLAVDLAAARL